MMVVLWFMVAVAAEAVVVAVVVMVVGHSFVAVMVARLPRKERVCYTNCHVPTIDTVDR